MLKLNPSVRDDILGELRIFIQSRFLLFRRRRHHRKTRSVCARFFLYRFFVSFVMHEYFLLEKTNKRLLLNIIIMDSKNYSLRLSLL